MEGDQTSLKDYYFGFLDKDEEVSKDPELRECMTGFSKTFSAFYNSELKNVSLALAAETEIISTKDAIPAGGMGAITARLEEKIRASGKGEIKLEEPVSKIVWCDAGDGMVTVTSKSGATKAESVIVTVPIGVLKKETTLFEPPLPQDKVIYRVIFNFCPVMINV